MTNVISQRDAARGIMNNITTALSSAISNSEGGSGGNTASLERALGGNTKDIWELWNTFYDDFDKFSTSMNTMYDQVVAAQTNNQGFEASTATAISSNLSNEDTTAS